MLFIDWDSKAQGIADPIYLFSDITVERDSSDLHLILNVEPPVAVDKFKIKEVCYSVYFSKDEFGNRVLIDKGSFENPIDNFLEEIEMYCYNYSGVKHSIKLNKLADIGFTNSDNIYVNYLVIADHWSSQIVMNRVWEYSLKKKD